MKTHFAGALLLSFLLTAGGSSAAPMQTSGRRVLDSCGNAFVVLNDVRVLRDYDIVARAGAANKAVREVFSTSANFAGQIVIRFLRGSVDEPKTSGIVIR